MGADVRPDGYSQKNIINVFFTNFLDVSMVLLFAVIAIGSILGNVVGYTLFPTIIFFAYGMMYSIPNIIYIFSLPLSLGITIIALLIITASAYIACFKE